MTTKEDFLSNKLFVYNQLIDGDSLISPSLCMSNPIQDSFALYRDCYIENETQLSICNMQTH